MHSALLSVLLASPAAADALSFNAHVGIDGQVPVTVRQGSYDDVDCNPGACRRDSVEARPGAYPVVGLGGRIGPVLLECGVLLLGGPNYGFPDVRLGVGWAAFSSGWGHTQAWLEGGLGSIGSEDFRSTDVGVAARHLWSALSWLQPFVELGVSYATSATESEQGDLVASARGRYLVPHLRLGAALGL